jgi:hypothetical protein
LVTSYMSHFIMAWSDSSPLEMSFLTSAAKCFSNTGLPFVSFATFLTFF